MMVVPVTPFKPIAQIADMRMDNTSQCGGICIVKGLWFGRFSTNQVQKMHLQKPSLVAVFFGVVGGLPPAVLELF